MISDELLYTDYNFNISLLTNILKTMINRDTFSMLYSFTTGLFDTINNNGKVILLGNGGSASDCDHIVGELRGRFIENDRPAINAISLTDSIATTTAIANDFGYDKLFSRQLMRMCFKNDSLIVLTTSGKSKNIIDSLNEISEKYPDINSLLITGKNENINTSAKYHIMIPIECSPNTVARIQECTMFLLHYMCKIIDTLYINRVNN